MELYNGENLCSGFLFLWPSYRLRGALRAGVCRPCDTIELTATSCNFSLCRRVEKICLDARATYAGPYALER